MSTDSQDIVTVRQIKKQVHSPEGILVILDGIDFSVNRGQSAAIIGASGSGKSTLLSLIAGLDVPSAGEIFISGQPMHNQNEEQRAAIRGANIGFVFQNFQLLPTMTAIENVALPLELKGDERAAGKAMQALTQVQLNNRAKHFPHQLSGGEQQRVAIARAFVSEPKLLLADEPTGNLDQLTGARIAEFLFQLNRQNQTTLIMVTHDEKLSKMCDHQFRIDQGRIQ